MGVGSDGRCSITKTNNKQASSVLTNWWLKVSEDKPASATKGGQRGQKVPKLLNSQCFLITAVTGITFIIWVDKLFFFKNNLFLPLAENYSF